MSMLNSTSLTAIVTFLGINTDGIDLCTDSQTKVEVSYEGLVGDSHSGLTRRSCVRVKSQYPKGTEIRNTRQLSALSAEELEQIRVAMDLDTLDAGWIGANLIVEGLPNFTKLPPSSRLIAANGTALVVDMENAPCRFPGDIIEQHRPGKGKLFRKAASGGRGVTLWVERPGSLEIGDKLQLHIPPLCQWRVPSADQATHSS